MDHENTRSFHLRLDHPVRRRERLLRNWWRIPRWNEDEEVLERSQLSPRDERHEELDIEPHEKIEQSEGGKIGGGSTWGT